MRTIFKIISVATLCLSLVATDADARGRQNSQSGQSQSQNDRRHHNPSRGPGGQRPGGNHQGGQRPGGNHQGGQRPGGNHQGGHRPGGNHQGNNRPGGYHQGNHHPGGNHGYPGHHPGGGHNFNPGHHPGGGHGGYGHVPHHRPHRPYMPAHHHHYHYRPPMPPPGFRPVHRPPLFASILGVTIGTAIGVSLDYLCGHGYAVSGYTDDAVYINNVTQLNLMWPNATLYYGAGGALRGSEFVYSTPYLDQTRYNTAYGYLTRSYGAPVSTMPLQGGGMRVNWFGYDGQYVSLQFQPATAYDGSYRYYTTLSFGI